MGPSPLERVTNLLTLLLETRVPLTLKQIANELAGMYPDKAVALRGAFERDKALLRDIGVPIDVANVAQLDALPTLRSASGDRHPVGFRYRDTDRELDPYGLLLREGFWYVIGHDHRYAEVRTYRVDRIQGAVTVLADRTFERPAGFDVRTAFPADSKMLGEAEDGATSAEVAVDPPLAAVVRAELGPDASVDERAGGSVVFRVPCANRDAFRSWVLGLGLHAEVLGPPEVRADLVAHLRSTAVGASGSAS
jgi:predicted DNA-binding transcriptional regulator YafY